MYIYQCIYIHIYTYCATFGAAEFAALWRTERRKEQVESESVRRYGAECFYVYTYSQTGAHTVVENRK